MLTKSDLKQIQTLLKKELNTELNPIKTKINKIDHKTDLICRFFDREYLDLEKRVYRIEEHLKLVSSPY